MKRIASYTTVLLAITLAGCSVLEESKVDYKTAQRTQPLEVPPDLSQIKSDSRYQLPGMSVSANQMQTGVQQASALPTAAQQFGEIKLERAGNQRWLVVSKSADQLWDPVLEFWKANGFVVKVNRPEIGVMETEWAENRAKLPMDFVRESLGKLLGSLYSTGELDKFRTRMERNADGSTEIYVSHKGMIEVYARERDDFTQWQPRPSDPELENEFLRRLMIALGTSQANAQAALPAAAKGSTPATKAAVKAAVESVDGIPTLWLQDSLDRAWRRVGLALDRSGFTVEERDRKTLTYTVRYVPSVAPGQAADPGFFAKLFSSKSKDSGPVQMKVLLLESGNRIQVRALTPDGQPNRSAQATDMLELLATDLQ